MSVLRRMVGSERRNKSRIGKGERGIWFWEHVIRNDKDYAAQVDYCHINPLKHGYVKLVADWPYSTFHRYVERGLYPLDWAGVHQSELEAGERG